MSDNVTDKNLGHQQALLLLHLLVAKERTLSKGDANKKVTPAKRRDLGFESGRQINDLREQLAKDGYIRGARVKSTQTYQLTDNGLALLAAQEQHPDLQIRMTGRDLNILLQAVREPADWKAETKTLPPPVPVVEAAPQDLKAEVYAIFQELERERAGSGQLVPIHEIRRRAGERWGQAVSRHDFDESIKQLRRDGKLRLVAISDGRDATEDQLNNSIRGINETLFYVGAAHESALVG